MSTSVEILGFPHYLGILNRSKLLFVSVFAPILIGGILLVLSMPDVYEAKAMLLAEGPDIAEYLVKASDGAASDQRIQVIAQRVMTSDRLMEVIEKYGLYPTLRQSDGLATLIRKMRSDIRLDTVSTTISNPATGRTSRATIAFALAYQHPDPKIAVSVSSELVDLFLAENERSRLETAQGAHRFLESEAERARLRVDEAAETLAQFKHKHAQHLPKTIASRQRQVERIELGLLDIDRTLRTLNEREALLQAQLAKR